MPEPHDPPGWRGRRYDCCDGFCGAGDCRRCRPNGLPVDKNDDPPFEDEPTDADGAKP